MPLGDSSLDGVVCKTCLTCMDVADISDGTAKQCPAHAAMTELPEMVLFGGHALYLAITDDIHTHTWYCARCGCTARERTTGFKKECQTRPSTRNNLRDINIRGHLPGQPAIPVRSTRRVQVEDLLLD